MKVGRSMEAKHPIPLVDKGPCLSGVAYTSPMAFTQDQTYADKVGNAFGTYHSTFRSKANQVEAQLFERNGWLIAYVSYPGGLKAEEVTDSWVSDLRAFAKDKNFEDRLKINYT